MTASGIAVPTTLAFIGGIGGLQLAVLVALLASCSVLFVAMRKEYSAQKSIMLTTGLYIAMAVWTIVIL